MVTDDSLEQLLIHADASAPAPAGNADLAVRVRRRLRRRRATLRVATALFLIGSIATVWLSHHSAPPAKQIVLHDPVPDQQRIDRLRGELVELASEAAVHERVANALLLMRDQRARLRERSEALTAPDPLEEVRRQRDRAAQILVRAAERAEGMEDDPGRATGLYRETARIFPDTRAGKEAARRLGSSGV